MGLNGDAQEPVWKIILILNEDFLTDLVPVMSDVLPEMDQEPL
jgi:hypothetical protein